MKVFELTVSDYKFKIVNERELSPIVYDLTSGLFINEEPLSKRKGAWEGMRDTENLTYVEHRQWAEVQYDLQDSMKKFNVESDIAAKVLKAFSNQSYQSWLDESRLMVVISILETQ